MIDGATTVADIDQKFESAVRSSTREQKDTAYRETARLVALPDDSSSYRSREQAVRIHIHG